MPIIAKCDKCGKTLRVKDELGGKRVRCPECGNPVLLPAGGTSRATAPAPTAPAAAPAGGKVCPGCGKPVPPNTQICPSCHYHLKLKKKMGISQAIKTADMHSQGLNLDGSKRITKADLAEQRAEQDQKVGKTMLYAMLAVIVILLAMAGLSIRNRLQPLTLDQLRELQQYTPPTASMPETWLPVGIYQEGDAKMSLTLPLSAITAREIGEGKNAVALPAPWPQGRAAWAAFAEAALLPVMDTVNDKGRSRYSFEEGSRVMPALVERANAIGGAYTPEKLAQKAPEGKLFVWRLAAKSADRVSLRGALLAFASDMTKTTLENAITNEEKSRKRREKDIEDEIAAYGSSREEAEKKYAAAPVAVKLSGRMSAIPFVNRDLKGTGVQSYAYAGAVRYGANSVKTDAKDAGGETPQLNDDCYFVPVLVVDNLEIIKPEKAKKKKKK